MRKHLLSKKKNLLHLSLSRNNSRTICCNQRLMIKSNCLDQTSSLQAKTISQESQLSRSAAMTSQSLALKQDCATVLFLRTTQTWWMLRIKRSAETRLTSFWMRSRPRCCTTRSAMNTKMNSLLHTISSHISSYAASACQHKTCKKTTTKFTQV